MPHNATITVKVSTPYTNGISKIRVLDRMVQKLGKCQIQHKRIVRSPFLLKGNLYHSPEQYAKYCQTVFPEFREQRVHNSASTRLTDKIILGLQIFLAHQSLKYQGPYIYGFRVNEVLRTDRRTEGQKNNNCPLCYLFYGFVMQIECR